MIVVTNDAMKKEVNRSFRSIRNELKSKEDKLNTKRLELDLDLEKQFVRVFTQDYEIILKYFDKKKLSQEDIKKFEDILENKLNNTKYFKNLSEDKKGKRLSGEFVNNEEKIFVHKL